MIREEIIAALAQLASNELIRLSKELDIFDVDKDRELFPLIYWFLADHESKMSILYGVLELLWHCRAELAKRLEVLV